MRAILAACVAPFLVSAGLSLTACGTKHGAGDDGNNGDGGVGGSDACAGLECNIVDCTGQPQPTDLNGYVFAPNGTLPLYGVNVYVPNSDPGTLTPGLDGTCDTCSSTLPGDPVVMTQTDEHGHFQLLNVPVADNLPVVIQVGKWRKILKLQTKPTACMPNTLPKVDTTLPATQTESGGDIVSVDMPQIAISTGGADALECLIRKLGISDKEIQTAGGSGRVHLYTDSGAMGSGASKFAAGFAGGSGNFVDSTKLWGTATAGTDTLAKYDISIFSCEGGQYTNTKPQAAMDAVKKYADGGGRLFLSHWHNVWIEGNEAAATPSPATWGANNTGKGGDGVAKFSNASTTLPDGAVDAVDTVDNPKGVSFATWLVDPTVEGTPATEPTMDQIPIGSTTGKSTCTSITTATDGTPVAETWVTYGSGAKEVVQNLQFTTPLEQPEISRCGKVVFSDMHVSGDSTSDPGTAYPGGCSAKPLTAQEKALAFMFFDIESCVGPPIARSF